MLASAVVFGQCPPDGYTANGQMNVDNFALLYPDCTELTGVLFIFNNVQNVDAFSNLTSIGGNLVMGSTAVNFDLSGFANLTSIGGDLTIQGNAGISSLAGFANLTTVGGVLRIDGNPLLTSLSGLDNLASLGSDVQIQSNAALLNLAGLEALTHVQGELNIGFNAALTTLEGVNNVESIGGRLFISSCDALTDLSGLSGLASVGAHVFISQNGVTSLNGLENLQSIGNYLTVQLNPALESIAALNHPISIGSYINFINNTLLSDCAVESVCTLIGVDPDLVSAVGNAPGCSFTDQITQACNCAGEDLDYTSPITTCGSYTLLGNTYTESGTYFVPYTNLSGCSGTITLDLTLNELAAVMQVDGNVLTATGNFVDINWLDCNNNFEPITGAIMNTFTATEAGSYAFEVFDGTCSYQSACETVVLTSVAQAFDGLDAVSVYPNPFTDIVRIAHQSHLPLTRLRSPLLQQCEA